MGRSEKNLKVECWRWRYRDPASGRICRTTFQLSSEQATALVEAERIAGLFRCARSSILKTRYPCFSNAMS